MTRAARLLAAAYAIDLAIGDPPWLPHPVRAIGLIIDIGERRWNRAGPAQGRRGALLSLAVIGGTALVAIGVVRLVRRIVPRVAIVAEACLGATTIATTDLIREGAAVADALDAGDLAHARTRLARIVGRDTQRLGASEIARAAIETLAESTCDGIVAPMFWFALGGVPAALAFKAASTLDSMIGHRTQRYERFGAAAARIDDALNFLPARATAVIAALASEAPAAAIGCAIRDARRHASPNAGWPESAFAGALGIRLGGTNWYDGERFDGPIFHASGSPPVASDIRHAIRLVQRCAAIAVAVAMRFCR